MEESWKEMKRSWALEPPSGEVMEDLHRVLLVARQVLRALLSR